MNSSLVDMKERPSGERMAKCIEMLFLELGSSCPIIDSRNYGGGNEALYVRGGREDEWCWVNIIEWPPGQSISDGYPYSCSIESRGDDLFSAIVVSAIASMFGGQVYDDAGYLYPGREFSPNEFRRELLLKIHQKPL
ncbi:MULTISPECIES: hypothetical protein [Burkholderia]|uniref:hypothetical protein n=1 Tax=Burkholderia TaxID=32008 RepID=UPI0011B00734|nr:MULTISPECIES: hypothetical protein [Burkholderia]MDF3091824.1 hypothetical protein [Burkholderia semiarida]MDF3107335.1 hypothetical protein [Burkholderia semiarida]WJN78174.1 hypothetical protein OH687_15195 [Burkholderia anthina]